MSRSGGGVGWVEGFRLRGRLGAGGQVKTLAMSAWEDGARSDLVWRVDRVVVTGHVRIAGRRRIRCDMIDAGYGAGYRVR